MSQAQELADSILHRYLTLIRYQRYSSALARKNHNLSGGQLSVLHYLIDNGPCTVGQVSQYLYVREATASLTLERMEQAGFVTRKRCQEDNRKVLVEATEAGKQVAEAASPTAILRLRHTLPEMNVETLEQIDDALAKLWEMANVDESVLD